MRLYSFRKARHELVRAHIKEWREGTVTPVCASGRLAGSHGAKHAEDVWS